MRKAYISKQLRAASLARVDQANTIIAEYLHQGYSLTLRQLYYQLVSRGMIANNQRSYDQLGSLISDARLLGLVDWDSIQDRTRHVREVSSWSNVKSILDSCRASYHLNRWENQRNHVEVWIEKDALVGVFGGICRELDLPLLSCRGYTSQSEMWSSAQRLARKGRDGKTLTVLHLGDHDPSGLDMTRDITERLNMFAAPYYVDVRRIALSMEQIEQYQCPPNPAKTTDSRAADYIAQWGDESWELDALEPSVLVQLVRDHVAPMVDSRLWEEVFEREERDRREIADVGGNWDGVVEWLRRGETDRDS